MKKRWILGCAALLACSGGEGSELPSAAAEDFHVRIPYQKYGFPGPWWREDATRSEFEDSLTACRRASTASRKARAEGEDEKDTAYRAFLDCMVGQGWSRGLPPVADASD